MSKANLLASFFVIMLLGFQTGTFVAQPTKTSASTNASGLEGAAAGFASLPGPPCLAPSPSDKSTIQVQASTSNASMSGYVVPPVLDRTASNLGNLSLSKTLRLEIVFAVRNLIQFQACTDSIYNPQSPNYRHFLNSTSLLPYLPTPGQRASVVSLLKHGGFNVSNGVSPLVIHATGTLRSAEKMLGASIYLYAKGHTKFYGLDSDPKFPQNLVSMITGISGLDNYSQIAPAAMGSPCTGPYCPQGIQAGYSISSLYGGGHDGTGVTVAIVDEPGDSNIQLAINTYDSKYNLPSTTITVLTPNGPPLSWDPGWAVEAAMDVEAVHTVAPGAHIDLLYGNGADDPVDLIDYVATNHIANVVSNSWGFICGGGPCSDTQLSSSFVASEHSRLAIDSSQGLTILFASGDQGATPDGTHLGTEFPASDPSVLAVGGTDLVLSGCNTTTCSGYSTETGAIISGGGYSGHFAEPSWQTSAIGAISGRGVPDVSMIGLNPFYWTYSTNGGGWQGVAGTSLSTPLWAGVIAIYDQLRGGTQLGNMAPTLWQLASSPSYSADFHDVTSGSNDYYGSGGYTAHTGWDPVTGWGTPIVSSLVATTLNAGSITPLSPTINSGQSVTLASHASGGITPYTYQWYNGAPCTGPISGAAGATYLASPTSTATYYYKVTDSVSKTACSAGDTVTVLDLSRGLVGYWPLDEGTGTLAHDSSGNGNTGTLTNSPTWQSGPSCKFGNCLNFATGKYVSVTDSPSLNPTNAITVSVWVKPASLSATQPDLIRKDVQYNIEASTTQTIFSVYISGWKSVVSNIALATSSWSHVVGVYDGANQYLYVNGVVAASSSQTGSIATSANALCFPNLCTTQVFSGSLDDVRIYNRALSASEVASLDPLSWGLVGYWPLDEGTGTLAHDSSGNGNTGTLTNSPTWQSGPSCKFGNCLNFATGKYVSVADSPSLDIPNDMTLAVWVNPAGLSATQPDLIRKGNQYNLQINNNQVMFSIVIGGVFKSVVSNTPLTTSSWSHVVGTYDGGNLRLYVNNVLVGSVAQTGSIDTSASALCFPNLCTTQVFSGSLDDVRIYNRALSASEVASLDPLSWGLVGYWPLDEGTGTKTFDASVNANTGTLMNSPPWKSGSSCKFGSCLSFASASSQYVVTSLSNAFPSGSAARTSTAWIYITANPSTFRTIAGYGANVPAQGFNMGIETGGDLGIRGIACDTWTSAALSLNAWHFVAIVYGGGTSVTMYQDASSIPGTLPCTLNTPASNQFFIGFANGGNYFDGRVDDVRIYNRALSASEVSALYNSGLGSPASSPAIPFLNLAVSLANSLHRHTLNPGTSAYYYTVSTDWRQVTNSQYSTLGNAFIIAGLVQLFRATGNSTYLTWASSSADSFWNNAWSAQGGGFYQTYSVSWQSLTCEEVLQDNAVFEIDYLALYGATGSAIWLQRANTLEALLNSRFWSAPAGVPQMGYDVCHGSPSGDGHIEVSLGSYLWATSTWAAATGNATYTSKMNSAASFAQQTLWDSTSNTLAGGVGSSDCSSPSGSLGFMRSAFLNPVSLEDCRKGANENAWGALGLASLYSLTSSAVLLNQVNADFAWVNGTFWDPAKGGYHNNSFRSGALRSACSSTGDARDYPGWTQAEQPMLWWLVGKITNNAALQKWSLVSERWSAQHQWNAAGPGGGVFTCLNSDGTPDPGSTNLYDWIQGGALYTFSTLSTG